MDTSIREMQIILKVFEEGGASKAAEKLFLTQPTISRIITRIENRIGTEIFDRSKYPWQLTTTGKLFINKTKKIIELENEFQKKVANFTDTKKGNLNIGTLYFEEKHVMPEALTLFYEKYPNVQIEFLSGQTLDLERAILNGIVDFSLLVLPITNKSINYIPLKKYNILIAIPKNDLLAKDYIYPPDNKSFPKIDIFSLKEYPFIFLNKKNLIRTEFMNACNKVGFEPKKGLEVEKIDMAHNFAIAGHGVAFVLDTIEKNSEMAYFLVENTEATQTLAFGYKKKKVLNKVEMDFLNIVKRVLQEQ